MGRRWDWVQCNSSLVTVEKCYTGYLHASVSRAFGLVSQLTKQQDVSSSRLISEGFKLWLFWELQLLICIHAAGERLVIGLPCKSFQVRNEEEQVPLYQMSEKKCSE